MTDHKVVSREEWQAARDELLQREKEHTRMADELARQRRELPWVAIEKEYRFDTDDGTRTLAELFDGRSQLLLYQFMFGPSYQAGCPVNSPVLLRPCQSVMARIECVAAEAGGDRFWAGAGPRGKVPGRGYMSGTSLGTAAGQVVLRAVASSRVRPSRRARATGSM